MFRLEGTTSTDELVAGNRTVVAQMNTGWISPGELGSRYRLRRLDLLTGSYNESDCDITLFKDLNASDAWQTATFDPDGSLDAWQHQDVSFDGDNMFTWLSLQFIQNEGTNLNAALLGYQMNISSRPFQRGTQANLNIAPDGSS